MPEEPQSPSAPRPPAAAAPVMAAQPWEGELVDGLRTAFGEAVLEASSYLGQNFVVVSPAAAIPVLEFLKVEADFDFLVDLTAVDYPTRPERFDLVYILYSFSRNERVRIKARVADKERPQSAVGVHPGANWLEREVYDMFGIEFQGHPNMTRILMPEDWEGFPLRKEYGITQMDSRWVKENLGIESGQ